VITVSDLRRELKLDATQEASLIGWVKCVIAQWEFLTNRLWNRRVAHVVEVDVEEDTDHVWVPLYPIETISVALAAEFSADPAAVLDASNYRVWRDTGRVRLAGGYRRGRQVATLTVTGGYTPATCPEDVRRALITQVHFMTRRMDAQAIIVNSLSYERGSTSYMTADYHPSFKNLADQRRRDV
jgi:hypothetical protein